MVEMLNSILLWRKILMLWLFPPGAIIFAILILYMLFIAKKKKIATCYSIILVVMLFLISSWSGEFLLLKPLEEKYGIKYNSSQVNFDLIQPVIVVLSGGFTTGNLSGDAANIEVGEITLARLIGSYFLYKKIECPIMVSGGPVFELNSKLSGADIMEKLLLDLGVPPEDIIKENKSRTTYENAKFSLSLSEELAFKEIILVTSAVHMPRAVMSFQNKNIDIIPAPVNFLYENIRPGILNILPNRSSWEHNLRALHEWAGLIYYWIIR